MTYTVVPGALDYAASLVAGDGIDSNVTADAAVTRSFTIAEADSFGNAREDAAGGIASKIAEGLNMTVRSARWPRSPSHSEYERRPDLRGVRLDEQGLRGVAPNDRVGSVDDATEIGGFTVRGSPRTTVLPGRRAVQMRRERPGPSGPSPEVADRRGGRARRL